MAIRCDNEGVGRRLAAYAAEREVWLQAVHEALAPDRRVVAAWLFGSLGRGSEDELSDLDLFVVVEDEALAGVIAARHAMMACVQAPLMVLEAPQNAPPGGAYNMALYAGADGPHQVDWYWQGRSRAAIPQETRLLFDRVGLPRLETPPQLGYQPVPERDPLEVVAQALNFGWVMLLIAAKYLARSPQEEGVGLAEYALNAMRDVRAFLELAEAPAVSLAGAEPAAKVAALRALAEQLHTLMPLLEQRGATVPWGVVEPARRYLSLIEAAAVGT
jgi:predicted nucleotidyltransferase